MRHWKIVVRICLLSSALGASHALAQESPAKSPPAAEPAPEVEVVPVQEVAPHDDAFAKPPPGTAADQALWKAGREVDNAIPMQRGESAKLQWRVKQGQFNERLEVVEKQGPADKARRARQAGEKVIAARDRNYEIITRRWPIDPTRVCSYPLLDFASALRAGSKPADKALQEESRKRLKDCVDKAQVILRSIEGSNKELRTALAALEAELPPGTPVAGPAGIPAPLVPVPPQAPPPAPRSAEGK